MESLQTFAYIGASVLFIIGLQMLGRAETAKRGNRVSALGMLVALVATLYFEAGLDFTWILVGLVVGAAIGAVAARRVQMTGMPEMVALLNGSGGLASLLVGWAEYARADRIAPFPAFAIVLTVLIGGLAATGSIVAFLKLSGRMDGKPIQFAGQKTVNGAILAIGLLAGAVLVVDAILAAGLPGGVVIVAFAVVLAVALVLGVMAVLPIGGADMPIVVSLLNSYSGIAAAAAGFVIDNNVLVVAGSLVGASGLILTNIMCKAMNRSLANVLFGGFGATVTAGSAAVQGEVKPLTPDDAYYILEAASSVVVVPGYGMAVAQAQHAVKELADQLTKAGAEVRYAIHPVAGRMPGHMNVLLAEANVPYEQLVEPDDVNPTMEMVDVAIVIGANDVVNPAAKEDESSPLYGMPIIEVDRARTCFVLKRSMNPGFSGVDNSLFLKDNTRMIFGDAKATLTAMVAAFKEV
ncbi:MAG: NAD(P)(+) transhydrogenase (Re/Si-specific) subunit beta [Trueperaceae bacterium]|nr:NAD(P)(+) transhydrogenase (Re/Si-specific) subunit beta [Trueperaceae bacterium]